MNLRHNTTASFVHDIQKPKYFPYRLVLYTSIIHCIAFPLNKSHSITNKTFNTDGIIMMFSFSVKQRS